MNAITSLAGRPLALRREVLEGLLRDLAAGQIVAARQELPRPAVRGPAGVGILPVFGVLEYRPSWFSEFLGGGTSTVALRGAVTALANDPEIKSIVLAIDSPGGEVAGITELAAAIRAARAQKPVVAIADTTAASAAYWIGAQASEFVCTPSGWVGSLGIYATHVDVSELEKKVGIRTTLISAGPYKTEGTEHEPLGADARAYAQAQVDTWYRILVDDIAIGRKVSPAKVLRDFGEGRMLLAKDALAVGMVDRIGTLESVIAEASVRAATAGAGFRGELAAHRIAAGLPGPAETFSAELARRKAASRPG